MLKKSLNLQTTGLAIVGITALVLLPELVNAQTEAHGVLTSARTGLTTTYNSYIKPFLQVLCTLFAIFCVFKIAPEAMSNDRDFEKVKGSIFGLIIVIIIGTIISTFSL